MRTCASEFALPKNEISSAAQNFNSILPISTISRIFYPVFECRLPQKCVQDDRLVEFAVVCSKNVDQFANFQCRFAIDCNQIDRFPIDCNQIEAQGPANKSMHTHPVAKLRARPIAQNPC